MGREGTDVLTKPTLLRPTTPPGVFRDARGTFVESWSGGFTAVAGLTSVSVRGALRGLHYQRSNPRALLVRCVRGAIWDVCVDLRAGAGFGHWYSNVLNDLYYETLHVPAGFAHGFCAVVGPAVVVYEADRPFDAASESTLLWSDPLLRSAWYGIPRDIDLIVSEKDAVGRTLSETEALRV